MLVMIAATATPTLRVSPLSLLDRKHIDICDTPTAGHMVRRLGSNNTRIDHGRYRRWHLHHARHAWRSHCCDRRLLPHGHHRELLRHDDGPGWSMVRLLRHPDWLNNLSHSCWWRPYFLLLFPM